MKRLSALLVGAFMLVGANSVMAFEGSGDYQLAPSNSAINAAKQPVSDTDAKSKCEVLPVSSDGEGISLERTCYTFNRADGSLTGPEFDTPQN